MTVLSVLFQVVSIASTVADNMLLKVWIHAAVASSLLDPRTKARKEGRQAGRQRTGRKAQSVQEGIKQTKGRQASRKAQSREEGKKEAGLSFI